MSDNEWPRQTPPPGDGEWGEPPHAPHRIMMTTALVLVVLLIAGGISWQLMRNGSAQPVARPSAAASPSEARPSVTPCPDAELTVVAAPEIEPVVRQAADTLNPDGQRCSPIVVRGEEPGVTVAAAQKPDVWVPSSSAWLPIMAQKGTAYTATGEPLAYSPVLLAGPEGINSLYIDEDRSSWLDLIQGIADGQIPSVTMPDPLGTTIGLLSVHGVNTATARAIEDDGMARLRALTLRNRVQVAGTDQTALLARMAAQPDASTAVYEVGIFPVIEQQLHTYQKADHPVRLSGAPPVDGRVEADYPVTLSKPALNRPAKKQLAERLRAAITEAAVEDAGFRTEPTAGALRLPAQADRVLGPARQWAQYKRVNFQVLLLIDSSGSMNETITDRGGKSTTKAELLRQSGAAAAGLFDDETDIGMWFFGTADRNGPAHTEQVPFGPIRADTDGKNRRAALVDAIKAYKPQSGAGTPLYQAVLDGVGEMRAKVKPDTSTVVVVLTDGADGGSRFAMSQQQFLKRLTDGQDPAKQVPIFAVGYGPDANAAALQGMARITGGKAIEARNPADLASAMAQAFLAARAPS